MFFKVFKPASHINLNKPGWGQKAHFTWPEPSKVSGHPTRFYLRPKLLNFNNLSDRTDTGAFNVLKRLADEVYKETKITEVWRKILKEKNNAVERKKNEEIKPLKRSILRIFTCRDKNKIELSTLQSKVKQCFLLLVLILELRVGFPAISIFQCLFVFLGAILGGGNIDGRIELHKTSAKDLAERKEMKEIENLQIKSDRKEK